MRTISGKIQNLHKISQHEEDVLLAVLRIQILPLTRHVIHPLPQKNQPLRVYLFKTKRLEIYIIMYILLFRKTATTTADTIFTVTARHERETRPYIIIVLLLYIYYTHTHTHTHAYIYCLDNV